MNKKFIRWSVGLLLCIVSQLQGQMSTSKYGNEWVVPGQTYYKIKVDEDGIYRVNVHQLQQLGFPISTVNAEQLQLYYMGESIPIHIEEQNGQIAYIEFYGQRNRGALDRELYRLEKDQLNKQHSIYGNTSSYFLTWNTQNHTAEHYATIPNQLMNLPIAESYFMHEVQQSFNDTWSRGRIYLIGGVAMTKSSFEGGEGYASQPLQEHQIQLSTPYPYLNSGKVAIAKVRAYNYKPGYGQFFQPQLSLNAVNPQLYGFMTMDSVGDYQLNFTPSALSNTNTLTFKGTRGTNDKYYVSEASIRYPRSFNFGGADYFEFELDASGSSRYLKIENFAGGSVNNQSVYLYDRTTRQRIKCYWDGVSVHIHLPASTQKRQLVLLNTLQSAYYKPVLRSNIQSKVYADYRQGQGKLVMISSEQLTQSSQGNPLEDYRLYRTSTQHYPTLWTVEELYDVFAYGVEQHPLAIRNFVAYIKQHWLVIPPKQVFLLGKAYDYTIAKKSIVPSFGYPASDNLLVSAPKSSKPLLAVGRIAVRTGDELNAYLQKVKNFEQVKNRMSTEDYSEWMKRFVFVGGGAYAGEREYFKLDLNALIEGIQSNPYLADIQTFYEYNDAPQLSFSTQMMDSVLNKGVGTLSFLGHGTFQSFDSYVGNLSGLSNYRYPSMFAWACKAGNIHSDNNYISEQLVLNPSAGAISLASFGEVVELRAALGLANKFYKELTATSIGESYTVNMQRTVETFINEGWINTSIFNELAVHYWTYHGDPTIALLDKNMVDVRIDEQAIEHTPTKLNSSLQDFNLQFPIENLGINNYNKLKVMLVRERQSGYTDTTYLEVDINNYREEVEVQLPINPVTDIGMNKVHIYIDSDDQIAETGTQGELNNTALNYSFIVESPYLYPVFPEEYAIIADSMPNFIATGINAFTASRQYFIEIDTSLDFNSPALIQQQIQSSQNVLEWQMTSKLENRQEYFWRVRELNQNPADIPYSSFVYIDTIQSGWNQSNPEQYLKNEVRYMDLDVMRNNPFSFQQTALELFAQTGNVSNGSYDEENLALYMNGSRVYRTRSPLQDGIYVAVVDPQTMELWNMPAYSTRYGAVNYDGQDAKAFLFQTYKASARDDLYYFLKDSIPVDHYVMLFTINNANNSMWSSQLVSHLQSAGAQNIQTWVHRPDGTPYTFFYQKGNPSYFGTKDYVAANPTSSAHLSGAMYEKWTVGQMWSPIIGPMTNWNKLEWLEQNIGAALDEDTYIDLYGVNLKGEKTKLYSYIHASTFDISNIDVQAYPYIQLAFHTEDIEEKTPGQLKYWRVLADRSFDLALQLNQNSYQQNDSLIQGTNLVVEADIQNIGKLMNDSFELQARIVGTNYQQVIPLKMNGRSTIQVPLNINTNQLQGNQLLILEVVVADTLLETNSYNNVGWLNFYVHSPILANKSPKNIEVNEVENYPNPFSEETFFYFNLKGANNYGELTLQVVDVRGSLIKEQGIELPQLYSNVEQSVQLSWDATNQSGERVGPGVYFYRVIHKVNGQSEVLSLDGKEKTIGRMLYMP